VPSKCEPQTRQDVLEDLLSFVASVPNRGALHTVPAGIDAFPILSFGPGSCCRLQSLQQPRDPLLSSFLPGTHRYDASLTMRHGNDCRAQVSLITSAAAAAPLRQSPGMPCAQIMHLDPALGGLPPPTYPIDDRR
jgi:hypothetical protein